MSSSSEPHTELFIAGEISFEYYEIDPFAAKHTYGRDDDLWDEFCYDFGSSENQAEWLTKEEEEHEYEYTNYGTEGEPRFGTVSYQVAGGGMMNGNAYATIEMKDGIYYYCEYGTNASRCSVGNKIVWSDEIYDKKEPYESRSFDIIDEEDFKIRMKEKVKDEWKRFQALRSIDREIPYVDIKPYSHNLISNYLRMLAGDDNKLTSKEDMNKIIVEKGLDKLGWELCKLD